MKIITIGCGHAFSYLNFNQSFLLEENGKRLLIDCGSRIPIALKNQKIDIKTIDAIYISHAHSDHIGGLEEIALTRYDWKNKPRTYKESKYAPLLIANKVLISELWENSLRGGLDTMEGFDASLDTFFEPVSVEPNMPYVWEGWNIDLIQQVHIMAGSTFKSAFGLFLSKENHKSVFFTTDCQYFQPRQVQVFYQRADIIIQDCECIGVDTKEKVFKFGSGVHANYAELAGYETANAMKLDNKIKAKLFLSHYQDFVTEGRDCFGNLCDWDKLAISDGFANGFLKVGKVFNI